MALQSVSEEVWTFWRSWSCHGLLARTIGTPLSGTAAPAEAIATCGPSSRVARAMGTPVIWPPVCSTLDTGELRSRFAALMGTPVRLLSPDAGAALAWADARPSKVIMTRVVAVLMVSTPLERDQGEASPQLLLDCGSDASLHRGMNCKNPAPTATWPDHYDPVMFGTMGWRPRVQPAESLA
jgi:hypothetical protein